jgi:hypothetical protein
MFLVCWWDKKHCDSEGVSLLLRRRLWFCLAQALHPDIIDKAVAGGWHTRGGSTSTGDCSCPAMHVPSYNRPRQTCNHLCNRC